MGHTDSAPQTESTAYTSSKSGSEWNISINQSLKFHANPTKHTAKAKTQELIQSIGKAFNFVILEFHGFYTVILQLLRQELEFLDGVPVSI